MRANGTLKLGCEMDEESRYGQMDLGMRDIGAMTKQMGEEGSFMLMVMFMKGNGKTTNLMDMECICTLTELSTRESGSKINKKAMG